jgi:hypothetical protein
MMPASLFLRSRLVVGSSRMPHLWQKVPHFLTALAERTVMMPASERASASLFLRSRLVVGSSSARMPHLWQKVSASASRTMRHASTCVAVANNHGSHINHEAPANLTWYMYNL